MMMRNPGWSRVEVKVIVCIEITDLGGGRFLDNISCSDGSAPPPCPCCCFQDRAVVSQAVHFIGAGHPCKTSAQDDDAFANPNLLGPTFWGKKSSVSWCRCARVDCDTSVSAKLTPDAFSSRS